MLKITFIQFVLYLSANNIGQSLSAKAFDQDKNKLVRAIADFNIAFKECDIEKLNAMITENYVHTNGNSKSIGKETWLTYLKKRKQSIKNGELVVHNYEMVDTEIEMNNDIAIVTARILVTSTASGEYLENQYRVTNIWVYDDGRWKRAGFHDGKIQ